MRLNPWFAVPTLVALVAGGALGWNLVGVSCDTGCPISQTVGALVTGLLVALGVGVVAAIAIGSLAERASARDRS